MLQSMKNLTIVVLSDRKAVTAIEYSLIAALIAVAIISAMSLVGGNISGTMSYIAGQV